MKNFVKNNKLIYVAVLLVVALVIGGFALSQAGLLSYNIIDDSKKSDAITVEAPSFSAESGFYDDPFYLELSVPKGTKVYYTLDSSDPNENSIEYTEPIYLQDASKNENVYSMRTDVSAGFRTDLIEKYQTNDANPEYVAPKEKVDKCNVVRAVAIDSVGDKSEIITKSYFVDFDLSEYKGTNIVSVVTDPDNLFDHNKGIYVTGQIFDDYISDGVVGTNWRAWETNYRQKGKEWERDCDVCFFDMNQNNICEQSAGIRIQGGVSRGTVPRSLNLFAKDVKDSNAKGRFTNLFDGDYYPSAVTLASGGNRIYTKINDVLMTEFVSSCDFATMKYKPYVLFLDGEYWGFYWLAERYNEDYISYYYNVDKDNILMIKTSEVAIGNAGQKAMYWKMKNDIIKSDMTTREAYIDACKQVDIDSFVDYYATMAYISRRLDWPQRNFALWRTVEVRDDKYSDGRWRWMLFDCNSLSMTNDLTEDDTLTYIIKNDPLFEAFWKNSEFRDLFKNRILQIANDNLNSIQVTSYIDDYNNQMYPLLSNSWERFHGKSYKKEKEYFDMLKSNKEFFEQRKTVVESWFN